MVTYKCENKAAAAKAVSKATVCLRGQVFLTSFFTKIHFLKNEMLRLGVGFMYLQSEHKLSADGHRHLLDYWCHMSGDLQSSS